MRRWLEAALVLGMGSLACGQAQQQGAMSKGADTFAVLRSEWARNLHDKRVAESVAEYAPQAEFMDPGGGRVQGTAALRELFQTITATYDSDLKFTSERTSMIGGMAYDSGTYQETLIVRASGRVEHSSGSYLTIYERGRAGEWLIAEQMWTGSISDAPAVARVPDSPPDPSLKQPADVMNLASRQ